jgi:hypothetical protein
LPPNYRLCEKRHCQGRTGAGQTSGDTIGNGRAMSLIFTREGFTAMLVDRDIDSAMETKSMIDKENVESFTFQADITIEENYRRIAEV